MKEKRKVCPALMYPDFEEHLFLDCEKFCICSITDHDCIGKDIESDYESGPIQRGNCFIDMDLITRCPAFGADPDLLAKLIQIRADADVTKKLKDV